ncbi:MAG: hypothetical protein DSY66_01650 [Persephonella sp.]|nr:MAG: hypothetical protein DSY66_01650 [Persephonella sp.]
MKKYILSFLTATSLATLVYATPIKYSASVYGTGLSYDKSLIKDNGYVVGVYGYMGIGYYHSLEIGLDYTHINYKNNNPDLDQTDLTFVYTNYYFTKTKLRMGFHYIDSDDKLSDGGYTVILGAYRYEPYKWNIGTDLFYSHYNDYINLNGSKGLDVYQITPRIGFYFGNYYKYGSFYAELSGTYINHSDDVGFGKSFSSVEGSLSYFIKNYSFTLSAWSGERSFMVDKGGFVVFNLREKYKYGVSLKGGMSLNKNLGLSASVDYQKFEEIGNPNDVKILTYMVNLGYSF